MKSQLLENCILTLALACVVFACPSEAQAQRGNVSVQLPTFHQFGVSTTVVVPDRGSLYLGGVHRSSLGQNQFGSPLLRPGNRSLSRTSSAGGISVRATIIDHNEIDQALLAEAARRRGAKFDTYGRPVVDAPRMPTDIVGQRWARGRAERRSTAPRRRQPFAPTRVRAFQKQSTD